MTTKKIENIQNLNKRLSSKKYIYNSKNLYKSFVLYASSNQMKRNINVILLFYCFIIDTNSFHIAFIFCAKL